MSHAQRRQLVDCPWLPPPEGPTVREQGEAMAQAICSPFGSADGRTFPTLAFDRHPSTPPAAKRRRLLEQIEDCLQDHSTDKK